MHLIASTGGNRFLTKIAVDHGFKYGAQLPTTVRHPELWFADQDWKKPEKHHRYLRMVKEWRPHLATVVDIECEDDMPRALAMADEIGPYVGHILWIPKMKGCIGRLPREVHGRECMLAYSVPTKYGGTTLPLDDFVGWKVHLLGGNPFQQADAVHKLWGRTEVYAVDGNFWVRQATRFCQFFHRERFLPARNRHWPTLKEYHGDKWVGNGPQEAFSRSCKTILAFWDDVLTGLAAGEFRGRQPAGGRGR